MKRNRGGALAARMGLTIGTFALLVGCGSDDDVTTDAGTGATDGSTAADGGTTSDGGSDATFGFSPSNVSIATIDAASGQAVAEDITGACTVTTSETSPGGDCFTSPMAAVKQSDGSIVSLVVVRSLTVEAKGAIRVTGATPLVVVSLADITFSGGSLEAGSAELNLGPGGAAAAGANVAGSGAGGGTAASSKSTSGASGGSYCGTGGTGGGGAGGGAVQLVAAGSFTLGSGSYVSVGGQGGPIGGLSTNQNAGGGGSGGSILIEASTASIAGTLAANGGGAGGDYSTHGGADGNASSTRAAGGVGGTDEGAGGAGGAGTTIAGGAGAAGTGLNAGGGGGGVGRVRVNTTSGTATVSGTLSPASSTSCTTQGMLRAVSAGP